MTASEAKKRGGLRFEVYPEFDPSAGTDTDGWVWYWRLVGKDGIVCVSPASFQSEQDARAHIHQNKGRLKACGYSKVVTIDAV